jgi:hypothetical protein
MGCISQEIRQALERAEERLRDLIVEAAKAGDYDSIDLARTVAGRVREMAEELLPQPGDEKTRSTDARRPNAPGARAGTIRRKHKGLDYPKFHVEDGVLHKVGWSKKESQEYVHKIPKEIYEQIIQTIGNARGGRKKLFTCQRLADELEALGFSVPIYQVYLTVALLRTKEIIEKKGREGYLAPRDVVAPAMRLWSEL